jgi:hypothetical protein
MFFVQVFRVRAYADHALRIEIRSVAAVTHHITSMQSRPAFSDLPLIKGDPHLSAWGLCGKDDELGTLNFLTEEVVRAAASVELG